MGKNQQQGQEEGGVWGQMRGGCTAGLVLATGSVKPAPSANVDVSPRHHRDLNLQATLRVLPCITL